MLLVHCEAKGQNHKPVCTKCLYKEGAIISCYDGKYTTINGNSDVDSSDARTLPYGQAIIISSTGNIQCTFVTVNLQNMQTYLNNINNA